LNLHKKTVQIGQRKFKRAVQQLGRGLRLGRSYDKTFNGYLLKADSKQLVERVRSNPFVRSVSPLPKVQLAPEESISSIDADMVYGLEDARGTSLTGEGVRIAVLDSGIDIDNPDL